MASVIGKRLCLHRRLAKQQQESDALQSEITQLQALANIGTVSCMIAHEINNLLTPLSSYATMALKNPDDKALIQKVLEKTVSSCERASKITESMLSLANGQKQEKRMVKLLSLVEEIFSGLCRDFAKDGIKVGIKIPEDLSVFAVPVQIQQVLMNLILNARDAMLDRGGVLTIEAAKKADTIAIEVRDTGCGIEPGDFNNIFESFFTTKTNKSPSSSFSGSGLGLAFCKRVIEAHGGCISVQSKPCEGSTFKISLPKG